MISLDYVPGVASSCHEIMDSIRRMWPFIGSNDISEDEESGRTGSIQENYYNSGERNKGMS